jgi:hypothetical protein
MFVLVLSRFCFCFSPGAQSRQFGIPQKPSWQKHSKAAAATAVSHHKTVSCLLWVSKIDSQDARGYKNMNSQPGVDGRPENSAEAHTALQKGYVL